MYPEEVGAAQEIADKEPDARGFRMGDVSVLAALKGSGWELSVSRMGRELAWEEIGEAARWVGEIVAGGRAPRFSAAVRPGAVVHLREDPPQRRRGDR